MIVGSDFVLTHRFHRIDLKSRTIAESVEMTFPLKDLESESLAALKQWYLDNLAKLEAAIASAVPPTDPPPVPEPAPVVALTDGSNPAPES